MNINLGQILLASGAILGSAAAYKAYEYATKDKRDDKRTVIPSLDKLKRVNIFSDNVINSSHLVSLISHRNHNGQAVMKIDESKLETTLRPFIRENLKKIFDSKGWSFDELEGKIYYSILRNSIEVYVIWKNHKFLQEYTNYDRFSMNF